MFWDSGSVPARQAAGRAQLLILDVNLPASAVWDFQHQLTDAGIQIPIIFITGHGDIPMTVKAMKSGAVEFLTKPFDDQELLNAVPPSFGSRPCDAPSAEQFCRAAKMLPGSERAASARS